MSGARPGRGAGATLEACLEEARAGTPAPVYLLDGDAYLTLRAARDLAAALVPEAQRALNLVELDAAASPAEVAAELATGGLFGGGKVVLAVEPTFLSSREDAQEAFLRARDQWSKGAQRDGVRRLLALAARGGWTARELLPEGGDVPDYDGLASDLGLELDLASRSFVAAAARFALERDLKVARDDAGALDALIAAGLPRGHVLLVAAGKVDGRLPLVKRLAAAGRRVSLALENRARPWEAPRLDLTPVLDAALAGTGKRVDAAGQALLAERVGENARALASEVAKLAAYVGERKVIGESDVAAVVVRVAEDPFFALGNAVEGRDLDQALAVIDRSFADGVTPYQLVGVLAGSLRRMIAERERARRVVGDRRLGSPREWEALVFPAVPEEERDGKKPFGFWMKYQASLRFARAELLEGLAALAEADVAMKSGFDGRLALERALLGLLSPGPAGPAERTTP